MFIGVDISGSFKQTSDYADALEFLSYYIYSHLNGLGGLEVPNVLFVSSIGGAHADEPKTFYPIQNFENKTIPEIKAKLEEIFPVAEMNPFTDYNAFFEQVAHTVKTKNLVLRPITVIMLSDGIPDVKREDATDFSSIRVEPLERLARNVTIRLLYTGAVVGKDWQTRVKRRRVKVWTQDAEVLRSWKDPSILLPGKPIEAQSYFFSWVQDNVDFGVRARRID
ncbi:MAG: hypothetical protein E4H13_02015 [Calditrichales bacterium]|nr:MAG: hypothetical protein E4H13_02015 [Calditrichales bacterium]